MKELMQDPVTPVVGLSPGRRWAFVELLRGASASTRKLAAIAVALVWIPPAVLCALHGGAALASFLTDYATQSRFLLVLPVLVLAAPSLHKRLSLVAHHFESFIPDTQLPTFKGGWTSFDRLAHSTLTRAVILLLTYALAIAASQYLNPAGTEFVPWFTAGGGGFRGFTPAATWTFFIGYPIVAYCTLVWVWRQLLWTRFMWSTARLDLRLVAAHPDHLGGIGFIESSLRGQQPFSFCLGVGLAGAVANRVFHHGEKLTAFSHVAAVLVAVVLLVCVMPYLVFTPILMQMRRLGLVRYGAFARAAGEHFEKKWLNQALTPDQDVLMVADFSAMHDLYAVVSNVNDIETIPVSRFDLYVLMIFAFVPAIPVVLGCIPFDIFARAALKLLF